MVDLYFYRSNLKKNKKNIYIYINTHRFLLPHHLGKDRDMDTSRKHVNMKDNCTDFLSVGQFNTCKKYSFWLHMSSSFIQNTFSVTS